MLILTIAFDEQSQAISYTGTMPLVLAQQLIQEIIIQERVKAELAKPNEANDRGEGQKA